MWFRRLIREFHRRSIWQVGSVFIAGSWLVLQVVDTLTESAGLPEWFPAFALGLLLLGLPFVLITAFLQEGLPGGDDAESPPPAEPEEAPFDRLFTWRNAALGGVAAFGLAAIVGWGWLARGGAADADGPDAGERASIAVLPFTLVGTQDADDEAFAYGMHDELLTRLAQLEGLRVTSRTSVMRYATAPTAIPDIGRELGVATILEGGIQRSRDRVRVNVQLIDAETDEHLWAETYERPFDDVFTLQSELTRAVAEQLRATLSPADSARVASRPTDDLAAYELVLEADRLSDLDPRENETAIALYQRALDRDPDYAAALSKLAWRYAYRVTAHGAPREWLDSALVLVTKAQRLAPEQSISWNAEGWIQQSLGSIDEARRAYRRAIDLSPSSAAPLLNLASIETISGNAEVGFPLAWRAALADPGDGFPWFQLFLGAQALDRPEDARMFIGRALEVEPGFFWALVTVSINGIGDRELENEVLEELRARDPTGLTTLQAEAVLHLRNDRPAEAAAAARRLAAAGGRTVFGGASAVAGIVLARAGLPDEARPLLEEGRRALAAGVGAPVPGALRLERAAVSMALGERTAALDTLRAGVEDGTIVASWLRDTALLDTDDPEVRRLIARAEELAVGRRAAADAAIAGMDPLPGIPDPRRAN